MPVRDEWSGRVTVLCFFEKCVMQKPPFAMRISNYIMIRIVGVRQHGTIRVSEAAKYLLMPVSYYMKWEG